MIHEHFDFLTCIEKPRRPVLKTYFQHLGVAYRAAAAVSPAAPFLSVCLRLFNVSTEVLLLSGFSRKVTQSGSSRLLGGRGGLKRGGSPSSRSWASQNVTHEKSHGIPVCAYACDVSVRPQGDPLKSSLPS